MTPHGPWTIKFDLSDINNQFCGVQDVAVSNKSLIYIQSNLFVISAFRLSLSCLQNSSCPDICPLSYFHGAISLATIFGKNLTCTIIKLEINDCTFQYILNKSGNATLQLSIFLRESIGQKVFIKLNNVS